MVLRSVVKLICLRRLIQERSDLRTDFSFLTGSSVLFDAVYVPGGEASVETLKMEPEAVNFLNEAYRHCKAIAATGEGTELINESYSGENAAQEALSVKQGVITSRDAGLAALQLNSLRPSLSIVTGNVRGYDFSKAQVKWLTSLWNSISRPTSPLPVGSIPGSNPGPVC